MYTDSTSLHGEYTVEIRFKLNPDIPRDMLIIKWLKELPKKERYVHIKEKLVNAINNNTPQQPIADSSSDTKNHLKNENLNAIIDKFSKW